MFLKKSVTRALLAVSAVAVVAAGCDAGSASPTGTTPGGAPIDSAQALATAKTVTAAGFEGTNRPVDPTPRAAVKGKKLAIVASGLAASSSKIPALGAEAAAKAAGWDVTVYDAGLNPARYPELVRQATAAGADGIIIVTFDCKDVKQPLEEAKAAGIAITSVYGFDCNDPRAGTEVSAPLFTAYTNFGPKAHDIVEFTESYGADQASYIIADSNNEATIIEIVAPEFTVLNHTSHGFRERIEQSGGSEIVSTLEITQNDIATSQLKAKVDAELLRHPEATWIKSPFTYVTTLGVAPALKPNSTLKVMGGEGFAEETDLMRDGKVTAVNVISSTWAGWAAVDTLNSVWRNEQPADSGIGWVLVDKDHGMPAGGSVEPGIDFEGIYRKAWGVR